jgi:hypothetical protein
MAKIAASFAFGELLAMTRQVALLLNLSLRGEAVPISDFDNIGSQKTTLFHVADNL